jgi:hypothetical protein
VRWKLRIALPLLAAALSLLVTRWTGPVLTVVLMIVAFGFVIDVATLLWSRSGGMAHHRQ